MHRPFWKPLWFVIFLSTSAIGQESLPQKWTDVPVFSGSPYDMGRQHGIVYRAEIRKLVAEVVHEHLPNWYHQFYAGFITNRMLTHVSPDQYEEWRGVADGAGVDFQDVVFGNLLPDINALSGNPFACSTIGIQPERSANGGLLVGRNLDWYHLLAGFMRDSLRAFIWERPGKHRILVIGYPGMTGALTAINDQGVFLSLMYSDSVDQTASGKPVTLIYRQVLERASSAREAMWLLETTKPRTIAINTFITDGSESFVMESSARHESFRRPEKGILYAANHFLSPLMATGDGADYRWPLLTALDDNHAALSLSDVRDLTAATAMKDTTWRNVKAVMIDYGSGTLFYGSDGDRAAHGRLFKLDLNGFWQRPPQRLGQKKNPPEAG